MNECKIVEDLIPLYAEDLTSEEGAVFVKNHVENCEHCRKLLERCEVTVPTPEEDVRAYKKALRKNVVNMTCRIVVVALIFMVVLYIGATKWGDYLMWWNGWAPVEQVVKAPVGNGEVTLVDWEASGWEIGGVENVGTILWMDTMDVVETEVGTLYSMSNTGDTRPWEYVQIYWAPNGIPFLATADLLEGGKGIFLHANERWYDEEGGHHSESRWLPSSQGNGLVDVLTELCRGNEDFPTGWESIEFTFHRWQDDSETITFVFETDTGIRGLIDYHYPTEAITKVN